MATLPTGTVTFLFTDIEGSTRLWEEHPDAMQTALECHDLLVRSAIERNGGVVFKTVGDGFCSTFADARDAIKAAIKIQRALLHSCWIGMRPLRVRVALHTGTPAQQRDNDYFGPAVNRVARLLAAGHGGQILLSRTTRELVRRALPAGISLSDLGEHTLKDIDGPERVFQLVASDLARSFAPLRTLEPAATQRDERPTSPPAGWRPEALFNRAMLLPGKPTAPPTLAA